MSDTPEIAALREKFEGWIKSGPLFCEGDWFFQRSDVNGRYYTFGLQRKWEAFQAGAQAAPREVPEAVREDDGELVNVIWLINNKIMERHTGSHPHILLAILKDAVLTWDTQKDEWHLSGGTRIFRQAPTRGQLRRLLEVLGGGK